ncbi:MAG: hypothetical protein G01um101431_498 [Parcubacteria group bacterium Gr01-1014_31]|nr:MAG: hypothetical protein G01um101431_498 [Parcubacteria group bacterium Gr01-1014_31]
MANSRLERVFDEFRALIQGGRLDEASVYWWLLEASGIASTRPIKKRRESVTGLEEYDVDVLRTPAIQIPSFRWSGRAQTLLASIEREQGQPLLLHHLIQYTEMELMSFRGTGMTTINEVRTNLATLGLSLGSIIGIELAKRILSM